MASSMDGLAQLRDIHLPMPIHDGLWAPGWIGLWVFFLLSLVFFIILSLWWRQRKLLKREALRLLVTCHRNYQQTKDSHIASANIAMLLRRTALAYYPRVDVAGLQGQVWLDFLTAQAKGLDFNKVKTALLICPYKKNVDCDLQPLFTLAKAWIQQRKKPCLN